jgi:hypothetical protein
MSLEQGPLSLVRTIEELLGRKRSGSDLENLEYSCRDPSGWPRDTIYLQELALSLPTNGGRSAGIVLSRTRATKFSFSFSVVATRATIYRILDELKETKNVRDKREKGRKWSASVSKEEVYSVARQAVARSKKWEFGVSARRKTEASTAHSSITTTLMD